MRSDLKELTSLFEELDPERRRMVLSLMKFLVTEQELEDMARVFDSARKQIDVVSSN